MNFADPVAALFPGAAGRAVGELARRHGRGESVVGLRVAAGAAAVVPEQFVRVATRLALLGLVRFPVTEEIVLIRENLFWDALLGLADPQLRIDDRLRDVAATCPPVTRIAVAGPVAAGTGRAFPEGLSVALIAPEGSVAAELVRDIAADLSRALGNACTVVVVPDVAAAVKALPLEGFRVVEALAARPAGHPG